MDPLVSVLLPVYNGGLHLKDAIASVLEQGFSDFELLVLDDGSSDSSRDIVRQFSDARIRLYANSENMGISDTLNRGLALARGRYIARMDADDICMPGRFERQVAYLDANPDVGLCGSWVKAIGASSGIWKVPIRHRDIVTQLYFTSCLMHPTVMMRKSVLDLFGAPYDAHFNGAEDYRLWTRLACRTQLANLPQPLLQYRVYGAARGVYKERQVALARRVREQYLEASLGALEQRELDALHAMAERRYEHTADFLQRCADTLLELRKRMAVRHGAEALSESVLVSEMYRVCSILSPAMNTYPAYSSFLSSVPGFFITKRLSLLYVHCRNRLRGIFGVNGGSA